MTGQHRRSLCVVVCGAGPATGVSKLVSQALSKGWRVQVVATPAGLAFLDVNQLEKLTGSAVRSDFGPRPPGPRTSAADALIVAPATFNTINKLATGVNDTYALNVLAEAIGRGRPVVVLPFVNQALAARRPFIDAVSSLRSEGVTVLLGPGIWEPHPAGEGDGRLDDFPWHLALAEAEPRTA